MTQTIALIETAGKSQVAVGRTKPSSRQPSALTRAVRTKATRDPDRTRRAILEAATVEFAAHGMGGARIDVVAEKSGSNKRMIYHYFGDKAGLYLEVLEQTFAKMRVAEAGLNVANVDPEVGMETLTRFVWRYFLDNPDLVSILGTENLLQARFLRKSVQAMKLNHELVERIAALLEAGQFASCFRKGCDPVTVFLTIASMSFFYVSNQHTLSTIFNRQLLDEPNALSWEDHIVHVVLSSISSKTPMRRWNLPSFQNAELPEASAPMNHSGRIA